MTNQFSRTELLLGANSTRCLKSAKIAVFGVGGVGGYAVEALARAGVGAFELFDHDTISITNLNRQIIALHSTIGRKKVDVISERILDINPDCLVIAHDVFYSLENADEYKLSGFDYIVDAIDSVASKICLIERASAAKTPIISAMGAGNKLNPMGFEVSDIYKTSVCPLARAIRAELKKRGIKNLKVVYSREQPLRPNYDKSDEGEAFGRMPPGSMPFVPPAAGLLIASEVIKDLLNSSPKP